MPTLPFRSLFVDFLFSLGSFSRLALVVCAIWAATVSSAPDCLAQTSTGDQPVAQTPDAAHPQRLAQPAEPVVADPESLSEEADTAAGQEKGPHEGIQVHGHWVIEVRNPDGTMTAQREFENSITPYGMEALVALLNGQASSTGFSVFLNASSFSWNPTQNLLKFKEAGPCLPINTVKVKVEGPAGGTACVITGSTGFLAKLCGFAKTSGQPYCSDNLVTKGSSSISLSGTVTATGQSGSVEDVETVVTTCGAGVSPIGCLTPPLTGRGALTRFALFTGRHLDGKGSDPAPVSYTTGQSINVSVTLSFQ